MAGSTIRVLVVEDNPGDARLVAWALAHEPGEGFTMERVDRVAAALERVAAGGVAVVLLDLGLPDSRGMDGVRRVRAAAPQTPVVVLTGSEDPVLVRHALLAGAQDYQIKGVFPPGHLAQVLRGAVRRELLEQQLAHAPPAERARWVDLAEDPIALADPGGYLVAASPSFRAIARLSAASSASPPAWLTDILTLDGPPPGVEADALAAGVAPIEGPPGSVLEVGYLIRRCGRGPDASRLILLRAPARAEAPVLSGAGPGAPIDEFAFAQLVELAAGDPSFVDALLSAFLAEAEPLVRSIGLAAERGDATSLTESAHRLKSAAGQVGAMNLSRACGELERSARAGRMDELRALARAVEREYPRVARALGEHRGSPTPPGSVD